MSEKFNDPNRIMALPHWQYAQLMEQHDSLQRESAELRAEIERMRESLQGIVDADWRTWDEGFASPNEFVQWAKSRAKHALESKAKP